MVCFFELGPKSVADTTRLSPNGDISPDSLLEMQMTMCVGSISLFPTMIMWLVPEVIVASRPL